MYISSTSNEKLKFLNSLKKKSVREESGLLLLEGERLVCDSERWGAEIVSVFYKEGYNGKTVECDESYTLSDKAFDKVAETVNSQGIIAVAKKAEADISDKDLLILCDNVRDPGNMGTIIRLAHAAGAALMISEGCVDPYSPKCVRASMGSVFATPPKVFTEELFNYLKKEEYTFYAGTLRDDSQPLFETKFGRKSVVVVGNEGDGVSEEMAAKCDRAVIIPMPGGAESLNVAAATAVLVYECLRQMEG